MTEVFTGIVSLEDREAVPLFAHPTKYLPASSRRRSEGTRSKKKEESDDDDEDEDENATVAWKEARQEAAAAVAEGITGKRN